ncbi:MAG: hypothetical protein IKZ87_03140 [Actinomycetaceae bacterium]|nr:hypothetical protein [Actinomycetaceae bacterium]
MEIPQWLSQTYVRSVQTAGSELPKEQISQACSDLVSRWSSPERRYHNVQHLIDTLTRIETLLPATHSPHLVQLAAWYHGIVFSVEMKDVYTRNGGEDECASARVAEEELTSLGVDREQAHRVAQLIRSLRTRDSEASSRTTAKFQAIDVDALVLQDAHLGCLSVEPQRYRTYLSQIRDEYAEVSDSGFYSARYEIISNLLHRRPLFITPLAQKWEDSARDNLELEREQLTKQLKELEMFSSLDSRLSSHSVPARVPVPNHIDASAGTSPASRSENSSQRLTSPIASPATSGEPTEQYTALTPDTAPETPSNASSEIPPEMTSELAPSTGKTLTTDELPVSDIKQTQAQAKAREKARSSVKTSEIPRARKDSFSSLEDISERIETDTASPRAKKSLSDEKKKRQREKVAEQMRLRMTQREQDASHHYEERSDDDERKAHESSLSCSCSEKIVRGEAEYEAISSSSIAIQEAEIAAVAQALPRDDESEINSATSAPSAETPEDTPSFGMEREPLD